ncbi:hypothetical protein ACH4TM_30495 [Streptomyces parvus]|uniref:hypothetical protein n=1 Tax=Streptomyces TaxID=1883 RepID=UPI0029A0DE06|nr:hypothetical protein [Streptomyces microflavus]MDX2403992.1 hypothetical protein [Streptomyces microflavus]
MPVVRVHESYHRVPKGLTAKDEDRLATAAVARLRAQGYHVACDADFDTDDRPATYPLSSASVAHLASRVRAATTTDETAAALTELAAPHDGVLTAIKEVLTATADFYDELGEPSDPHIARRLRYLADEVLRTIRTDLSDTRDQLADRHAPHPGRSTCAQEVPANERERSAVCACPPPPRTLPTPPPPVAVGLRR